MLSIVLIISSTRVHRVGDVVANWLVNEMERQYGDLDVSVIDLRELELPDVGHPDTTDRSTLRSQLDTADGFVVVVPEYNHGYPAPLKLAIDLTSDEWAGKPVAFVSYGGVSGGIRAVEQLRQVFAEMHAVTVRNGVTIHRVRHQFDEDGQPVDSILSEMAKRMLEQLAWWAEILQQGREKAPYPS